MNEAIRQASAQLSWKTSVVSALGATIAVITITLVIMTAYLSYKVYYMNDVHLSIEVVTEEKAAEMTTENIKTTAAVLEQPRLRKKAATTLKKEEIEVYRETFEEVDIETGRVPIQKKAATAKKPPRAAMIQSPNRRAVVEALGHNDIEFEIVENLDEPQ